MFTTLATAVTPWFDNPSMVAAVLGSGVGVFGGGVYGPLAGILAPQGKARSLVMTFHWSLIVVGLLLLGAGFVGMVSGQPYAVWFALLLPGLLLTAVLGPLTPIIRLRYRQAEMRRLEAEEFRRT